MKNKKTLGVFVKNHQGLKEALLEQGIVSPDQLCLLAPPKNNPSLESSVTVRSGVLENVNGRLEMQAVGNEEYKVLSLYNDRLDLYASLHQTKLKFKF